MRERQISFERKKIHSNLFSTSGETTGTVGMGGQAILTAMPQIFHRDTWRAIPVDKTEIAIISAYSTWTKPSIPEGSHKLSRQCGSKSHR